MEENVIVIGGKKINYANLSDDNLISLYKQLKEREIKLFNKIVAYQEKYDFLPDVDFNDITTTNDNIG